MLSLIKRSLEFTAYHLVIKAVDKISKLPRNSQPSDLERLYRENLALKAQLEAVKREIKPAVGAGRRLSFRTRAAEVFAFLLNRGNKPFHKYYLTSSKATVENWVTKLRRSPWPWSKKVKGRKPGRPATADQVRTIVIYLKKQNPKWGVPRIHSALAEVGVQVSKTTIRSILEEAGLLPTSPEPVNWDRFRSSAKDALWAMDYFVAHTTKGVKLQVMLVLDVFTRELMELRVYDGWDVDSYWTSMAFNECRCREKRQPKAVVHDRATYFEEQFMRQMSVLDIGQRHTPAKQPLANIFAERTVLTVRFELLNHIRFEDAEELQWYLDEFRAWYNEFRVHQGIEGRPPARYATEEPQADVVSIEELRHRRLRRHEFAHGLLNGYDLVPANSDDDDECLAVA